MELIDKLFFTAIIVAVVGFSSIKADPRPVEEVPMPIVILKVVPTAISIVAIVILVLVKIWA